MAEDSGAGTTGSGDAPGGRWTAADIGSQVGRTFLVTGANSGLGLATSTALTRAGARVVMTARDPERGRAALAEVTAAAGPGAELRTFDLADLASVRAFAAEWGEEPLDVLVNNAGVMAVPQRRLTADGYELQLGTNHLGHFALTNLLLPRIRDRVVTVSSSGHRMAGLDLTDLDWRRRRYRRWSAYGASKLANLLFTLELQRRLASDPSADRASVRALAAHPGLSSTNLFQPRFPVVERIGRVMINAFGQPAQMGALPQLYAATVDLPSGSYVGPDGRGEATGYPELVGRSKQALDAAVAQQLWTASERLTGVSHPPS